MANKDCHLLPQCFRVILKHASSKAALQRPDMKIDPCEISNRFEFRFCLHEVVSGQSEISSV